MKQILNSTIVGISLYAGLAGSPVLAQQNTTRNEVAECFQVSLAGMSPVERIDLEKECLSVATEYVLDLPSANNHVQMLRLRSAFMEGREYGIKNPNITNKERFQISRDFTIQNYGNLDFTEQVDIITAYSAGMNGVVTKKDIDLLNEAGKVNN